MFKNVFEYKILKLRRYITMDNVMTKGFTELSATEMEEIDGGVLTLAVAGCLITIFGIGFAGGIAVGLNRKNRS